VHAGAALQHLGDQVPGVCPAAALQVPLERLRQSLEEVTGYAAAVSQDRVSHDAYPVPTGVAAVAC
jgi:hypothetical protein